MCYIVLTSSQADFPQIIGPYQSHQMANQAMQEDFDLAKEWAEEEGQGVEADDSDGSHFVLEAGDDLRIDWYVVDGVTDIHSKWGWH